jgi:hypothetical protein
VKLPDQRSEHSSAFFVKKLLKNMRNQSQRFPAVCSDLLFDGTSYKLRTRPRPSSTCFILSVESLPIRSVRNDLSRVTTWETLATESFESLVIRFPRNTLPGAAWFRTGRRSKCGPPDISALHHHSSLGMDTACASSTAESTDAFSDAYTWSSFSLTPA